MTDDRFVVKINMWLPVMFLTFFPLILGEGFRIVFQIPAIITTRVPYAIFAFTLLMYVFAKKKPSKIQIVIFFIYFTIFFSAYIKGVLTTLVLPTLFNGLVMCTVCDFWLQFKYRSFIDMARWLLVFVVVANFISVLMYPDGMYETTLYTQNWLLGYKNSHFNYIMPSALLLCVNSYRKNKKLSRMAIAYLIMCCFSLYLVDSAAALLIFVIFTAVMILLINHREKHFAKTLLKAMNLKNVIICTIILSVLIFFMEDLLILQSALTGVVGMVGRDVTFTGRTEIWKISLDLIKQSPIYGHGMISSVDFVRLTKIGGGTHAHNYILNIAIMGGIVCIIEHIVLYKMIITNIVKRKDFYSYTTGITLGLYFLIGITNINFYSVLFNAIFIFTFHILHAEAISFAKTTNDSEK